MADSNNYDKDRELLKKALIEGINARFDELVENSNFDGDCSEKFHTNVKKMLGIEEEKQPEKKIELKKIRKLTLPKLIAIILAAVLLTGCALVCIYRDEIVEFFEYNFDNYTKLNDGDTVEKDIIKDVYTLTYVPEGFELKKSIQEPNLIKHIWESAKDGFLKYAQTARNTQSYVDAENGYNFLVNTNNVNIYHKVDNKLNVYVWYNSNYDFKISTNIELTVDELEKIILGMTLSE